MVIFGVFHGVCFFDMLKCFNKLFEGTFIDINTFFKQFHKKLVGVCVECDVDKLI